MSFSFHPFRHSHRPGETLIEVIVATAILVMIVSGFARLAIGSYDGVRRGGEQTVAASLAQQGAEAARSIARHNFADLVDGPHGLSEVSSAYAFSGTSESLNGGKFQRVITVASVQRDASDIQVLSAGTVDPLTKKITSTVTWTAQAGGVQTVTYTTEVAQWNLFRWLESTLVDFATGQEDSTTTTAVGDGAVQLQSMTTPTTLSVSTTFDPGGTTRVFDLHADATGDRLLVSTGNNLAATEFFSYDISNVSNATPSLLGSTELSATGSVFTVAGDYAYIALANITNQIAVVRLSDMSLQTTWTIPGNTVIRDIIYDSARNQLLVGRAYNASQSELLVLSLTSSTTYTSSGLDFTTDVRGIAITGSTAFLIMNNASGELQPVTLAPLAASTACDLTGTAIPNAVVVNGGDLLFARAAGTTAFSEYTFNPASPSDCTYLNAHLNGQATLAGNAVVVTPIPAQNMAIVLTDSAVDYTVNLTSFVGTSFNPSSNACDRAVSHGAYQYVGCRISPTRLQILQGTNLTEELVYTDSVQNSWTITNPSGINTTAAYSYLFRTGASSLVLNPGINGSTQFNKSFSTSNASALDFYVNTVSPWAFSLYGGGTPVKAANVTVTNGTYLTPYEDNIAEGSFTDFPVPDFVALKAAAPTSPTNCQFTGLTAARTLGLSTHTNLPAGCDGKVVYVEFTTPNILTIDFENSNAAFTNTFVVKNATRVAISRYNSNTAFSAVAGYPVIVSSSEIRYSTVNKSLTINGILFSQVYVNNASNRNQVVNGSVIAQTVSAAFPVNMTINYSTTTNYNTSPPLGFTPNYYGQNLSLQASAGNAVTLNTYISGGIDKDPTTWQQVYVPVADLGSIGSPISYFKIFDATATNQPSIFIDDLRWVISAGGGGALPTWGTFTSPAQSIGTATAWKYIKGTVSGNGQVAFRIRTASTQGGLATAKWVGSGGTVSTSYPSGVWQPIITDPLASGIAWSQWKAYFTGDGSQNPVLQDVTLLSQ
ncbi:MAG: hypothetical protein WCG83_03350 [Candidatus Peregrinibacteria bacterium]